MSNCDIQYCLGRLRRSRSPYSCVEFCRRAIGAVELAHGQHQRGDKCAGFHDGTLLVVMAADD